MRRRLWILLLAILAVVPSFWAATAYAAPNDGTTASLTVQIFPRSPGVWFYLRGDGPLPALLTTDAGQDSLRDAFCAAIGVPISGVEVDTDDDGGDEKPASAPDGWTVDASTLPDYNPLSVEGHIVRGRFDPAPLLRRLKLLGFSHLDVLVTENNNGAPTALCTGAREIKTSSLIPCAWWPYARVQFEADYATDGAASPEPLEFAIGYSATDLLWIWCASGIALLAPIGAVLVGRRRVFRRVREVMAATEAGTAEAFADICRSDERIRVILFGYFRLLARIFLSFWLIWLSLLCAGVDPVNALHYPRLWRSVDASLGAHLLFVLTGSACVHILAALLTRPVLRRLRNRDLGGVELMMQSGATLTLYMPTVLAAGMAYTCLVDSVVGHFSGTHGHASLLHSAGLWRGLGYLTMVPLLLSLTNIAFLTRRGHGTTVLRDGPIRERVDALTQQAGVTVKEVSYMATGAMRMANAFALPSNKILLTDHLLAEMRRTEIDAIMAHEIAHVRYKHLRRRRLILLCLLPLIAGMTYLILSLGGQDWVEVRLRLPLLVAVIGPLVKLCFQGISRRDERQADLYAAQLIGDPRPLITGLTRLHQFVGLPTQWRASQARWLSHPATHERARYLAKAGGVTDEELDKLLAEGESLETPPAEERYALPVDIDPQERIFSDRIRNLYYQIYVWCTLLVAAGISLAFGYAATEGHSIVAILLSYALAFSALYAFGSLFSRWHSRILHAQREPLLRARLLANEPANLAAKAVFVEYAPGSKPLAYGLLLSWDIGYLILDRDRLRLIGERSTLTLRREWLSDIRYAASWPMHSFSRLVIVWKAPPLEDGTTAPEERHSINLLPANAADARVARRLTADLREQIEAWIRDVPPNLSEDDSLVTPPLLAATQSGQSPMHFATVKHLRSILVTYFLLIFAIGGAAGVPGIVLGQALAIALLYATSQWFRFRRVALRYGRRAAYSPAMNS